MFIFYFKNDKLESLNELSFEKGYIGIRYLIGTMTIRPFAVVGSTTILKVLGDTFSYKSIPYIWWIIWVCWGKVVNLLRLLFGQLLKHLGYFLFQYLAKPSTPYKTYFIFTCFSIIENVLKWAIPGLFFMYFCYSKTFYRIFGKWLCLSC